MLVSIAIAGGESHCFGPEDGAGAGAGAGAEAGAAGAGVVADSSSELQANAATVKIINTAARA
ncbi:MAG: hypothetical protein IIB17_00890 [Chloroflexi bacterium]|nr:hypothetical protein [Chloroflexota bacterium]